MRTLDSDAHDLSAAASPAEAAACAQQPTPSPAPLNKIATSNSGTLSRHAPETAHCVTAGTCRPAPLPSPRGQSPGTALRGVPTRPRLQGTADEEGRHACAAHCRQAAGPVSGLSNRQWRVACPQELATREGPVNRLWRIRTCLHSSGDVEMLQLISSKGAGSGPLHWQRHSLQLLACAPEGAGRGAHGSKGCACNEAGRQGGLWQDMDRDHGRKHAGMYRPDGLGEGGSPSRDHSTTCKPCRAACCLGRSARERRTHLLRHCSTRRCRSRQWPPTGSHLQQGATLCTAVCTAVSSSRWEGERRTGWECHITAWQRRFAML